MNKAILVVLWTVVTLFSVLPVLSTAAETERFWVRMNPERFESTPASAAEQCARVAALSNSGVTEESCKTLKVMLEEDMCDVEVVSDGIRFDYMSTYEKGRPAVVGPMTKKLGREDLAMVCDIEDGVTAYFFIGEERSCGNLAVVVERAEVMEKEEIDEAILDQVSTPPAEEKCRWVKVSEQTDYVPGQIYLAHPISVPICGGGSAIVGGGVYQTPSTTDVSATYKQVCN